VVEVVRVDEQGLRGAYTSLQVIRKIGKRVRLLVNMVPEDAVSTGKKMVEERLKASVLGLIPFFNDIWATRDDGVFILGHPDHQFSIIVKELVEKLPEKEPLKRQREKERVPTPSREKLEQGYY